MGLSMIAESHKTIDKRLVVCSSQDEGSVRFEMFGMKALPLSNSTDTP
jgi:hypothetical protein